MTLILKSHLGLKSTSSFTFLPPRIHHPNSTDFFLQIAVCSLHPPPPVFFGLYHHFVQTFIIPGMYLGIFILLSFFLFQSVLFSVNRLLIPSFPLAHFCSFSFAYLIKSKLHSLIVRHSQSCSYPLKFKIL